MPVSVRIRTRVDDLGRLFLVVNYMGAEEEVGPVTTDFEAMAVLEPPSVSGRTTNAKKLRRRATKIENRIAEAIGGKRNKGSGSLSYLKGDVRKRGVVRVESKFTQNKSYSVRLEDLRKIEGECSQGESPAFDITFVEPVTLREIDSWVLIPREEWQRLMEVDSAATDHR